MSDYEPMERADLEQMATAARDMARVCQAFYGGLIEQGFSAAEALKLTGEYVTAIVRGQAS